MAASFGNNSTFHFKKNRTNKFIKKSGVCLKSKFGYLQNAQVSMNNNIFNEVSNPKEKKVKFN